MDESLDEQQQPLDIAAIRERLAGERGKQYWRSLEQVAETPQFQKWLDDEFPNRSSLLDVDRRQFLKVMGAALALAGLAGCRKLPQEKIVPYVKNPEEIVEGKPLAYATAMTVGGFATGLLVESREGRPIKVEGNPDHPASLGATDPWAQASILTMYDPDRSQVVTNLGEVSTWEAFLVAARAGLEQQAASRGAGLRILTETVTSPTLIGQLQALLARYPAAKWHQYEPSGRDNARAGAEAAFGRIVNPVYRFDRADVILSLDADFLLEMPGSSVRYARDFIDRRRVRADRRSMNRLYVAESAYTITGAMADHRLPLRPSQVEPLARAVAAGLGLAPAGGAPAPEGVPAGWVDALVRDLQAHRGTSLVIAGETQPPAVHALAHAMNEALGNANRTVVYTAPVEANAGNQTASLRELVDDMKAGRVQMLVMLGGNPVYNAPADLEFARHLTARDGDRDRIPLRIHHGLYEDETSYLCNWHIPESHYLETWGDARAFDGTASIVQPLIAPLYEGSRSAHAFVAALLNAPRTDYQAVTEFWGRQPQVTAGGGDFNRWWERTLNSGVVEGTALPPVAVRVRPGAGTAPAASPAPAAGGPGALEVVFRPDPMIWDGRFANNSWLQEMSKPITKLTWDNAALLSPGTAESLGLTNGEMVNLTVEGRTLPVAVWMVPGLAPNTVVLHLGYGRSNAGKVGNGMGFNAYRLRSSDRPGFLVGASLQRTGERYQLATTQEHHSMEGRDIVRSGNIQQWDRNPSLAPETENERTQEDTDHGGTGVESELSLYPEFDYSDQYAWAMTIDLNACIGCNTCNIACQAENNIPTVGKDQVARGREMHWIHVDHYYKGGLDNPESVFQPRPCMHCEKAPCEPVCPVAATIHSHEGLNMMIYNRCVGTRYCSNNCPYKVRRFNFLKWTAGAGGVKTVNFDLPVLKMLANPEVTVRGRGVMEKCTYCVQRINTARIEAKREDRRIRDGEVVPACAQACPTRAIVFGDLNDPNSRVRKTKREPHNFGLLTELNTQPRTSYLGRLRNPNPDMPAAAGAATERSEG